MTEIELDDYFVWSSETRDFKFSRTN